jgi:hypothetical protein
VVFTALSISSAIEGTLANLPTALISVLNMRVSLKRVDAFLALPSRRQPSLSQHGIIVFDHATIEWPTSDSIGGAHSIFKLSDVYFY